MLTSEEPTHYQKIVLALSETFYKASNSRMAAVVAEEILLMLTILWLHRTGLPFRSALGQLDESTPPVLLFSHNGQRPDSIIMASDRIQRQIERLLDEADEAITKEDWSTLFGSQQSRHALFYREYGTPLVPLHRLI